VKDFVPEPVADLAIKIDHLLLTNGEWSEQERVLFVPALAVLVGKFVAFEAGGRERIPRGLDLAAALMGASAFLAAEEFYSKKGNGG
jgi:hypothetical protein